MKNLIEILKSSKFRIVYMIAFLIFDAALFVSAVSYKQNSTTGKMNFELISLENGKQLVHARDIKAWLQKKIDGETENISISDVNTRKIEQLLFDHPNVKNAEVYVDALNELNVRIEQKVPIFRMMNNGGSYYLSADGDRIPLSKNYTVRAIIVSGDIPTEKENLDKNEKETLQRLSDFYDIVKEDDFMVSLIDHIKINSSKDFVISPLLGDLKIIFGNMGNSEDKIFRLKEFYKKILSVEAWEKYETIDLRFKDQVIAKKRN